MLYCKMIRTRFACLALCMSWFCQGLAGVSRSINGSGSVDHDLTPEETSIENQLAAILEKLSSLDERVTSLGKRMDDMGGQVAQLLLRSSDSKINQVLEDLDGVCKELESVPGRRKNGEEDTSSSSPHGETTVKESTTTTTPEPHYTSYFRLTRVKREITETMFKVTVYYEGPSKPVVKQRLENYDLYRSVEHSQFGVFTTEIEKPVPGKESEISLEFKMPDIMMYLNVRLDEKTADEMDLADVQISVTPSSGNDLVYTPGHDLDMSFRVTNKDEQLLSNFELQSSLVMKSHTAANTVDMYRLHPEMQPIIEEFNVQYNESMKVNGTSTASVHIPYDADRELEGVVRFFFVSFYYCDHPCLVNVFYAGASIDFYPQGHEGPFPPNFVGFVRRQKGPEEWEDKNTVECSTNWDYYRECILSCSVMGDNPSVVFSQIRTGRSQSNYEIKTYDEPDDLASTAVTIPDVTFDDAGEFVCSAHSGDSPVITKTTFLTIKQDAKIFTNQSYAWKFENGSVTAYCAADGIPTPRVTFFNPTAMNNSDLSQLDEADYEVVHNPVNETTAEAYLFISNVQKYDWMYYVICYATNAPEHKTWDFDETLLYFEDK